MADLIGTAQQAAYEAGKKILEIAGSGVMNKVPTGNFPSTIADKSSCRIITGYLAKTGLPVLSEEGFHPDFGERKNWEYFWLVDPLDGTVEFIHQNGEFTINIALIRQNIPVAGVISVPCRSTLYYGSAETGVYKNEHGKLVRFPPLAQRNRLSDLLKKKPATVVVSRSHLTSETLEFIKKFPEVSVRPMGSSLKFMVLLENAADIYPRFGTTMEWDTAAAHAILNATNRGVYLPDLQSELTYNKPELKNPFFIAF